GAAAGRRRLVRVRYSPAGVTADDVIRDEVAGIPARTPVVVVTNDQAIVGDVRASGANVVSADVLLVVSGRTAAR
ncbi:MAG TPA: NYN domain-containing protein, partial [Ilumatobacteraceae bacterium]